MDIKEIQELIKFVAKSGATEVDLEIDNVKISIKSPPKKRRGEASEDAVKIVHQAHSHPVVVPQNQTNTQHAVVCVCKLMFCYVYWGGTGKIY